MYVCECIYVGASFLLKLTLSFGSRLCILGARLCIETVSCKFLTSYREERADDSDDCVFQTGFKDYGFIVKQLGTRSADSGSVNYIYICLCDVYASIFDCVRRVLLCCIVSAYSAVPFLKCCFVS